jgi:hypothetical protein
MWCGCFDIVLILESCGITGTSGKGIQIYRKLVPKPSMLEISSSRDLLFLFASNGTITVVYALGHFGEQVEFCENDKAHGEKRTKRSTLEIRARMMQVKHKSGACGGSDSIAFDWIG